MAGHSKFKNIQHRKGAQDNKRAKIFTKLVREILTAAKSGIPDPAINSRLRSAIAAARLQNLPKERIDRAINQASDPHSSENYQEIRYEGFAAGGIAIIVEALTDNKNRTASEVRSSFTKFGGNLGETGSISFMFIHAGFMRYNNDVASFDDVLETALEAGADDVISENDHYEIYTSIENFTICLELMNNKYGTAIEASIIWKPKNIIEINNMEKAEKLLKLVDALEESDDVQQVFGNYEFTDEICEKLLN